MYTLFFINAFFALTMMKVDQGIALVNLACCIVCAIHITFIQPSEKKEENKDEQE